MRLIDSRILATGLLLLLTLASGLWLGLSGKPYSTAIFTIHKLIALGAVIAAGVTFNHLRMSNSVSMLAASAMITAGALFLALFVSGALLSIGKPDHAAILVIHRAAPLLAVLAATTAVYLMTTAQSAH
jgi:hypothetical protein